MKKKKKRRTVVFRTAKPKKKGKGGFVWLSEGGGRKVLLLFWREKRGANTVLGSGEKRKRKKFARSFSLWEKTWGLRSIRPTGGGGGMVSLLKLTGKLRCTPGGELFLLSNIQGEKNKKGEVLMNDCSKNDHQAWLGTKGVPRSGSGGKVGSMSRSQKKVLPPPPQRRRGGKKEDGNGTRRSPTGKKKGRAMQSSLNFNYGVAAQKGRTANHIVDAWGEKEKCELLPATG